MLPRSAAVVSVDRDRVARDLRARADDMRGVLSRQGAQAREALRTLLVDRFDCTPVLVAGTRGYAFTGDGTFGGLRPARGPLPLVAPTGFEPVFGHGHVFASRIASFSVVKAAECRRD